MNNQIEHPSHYGGEDNVYEAIKVIEAWDLGFCLGNVVKYLSRCGKKEGNSREQDLKKALWYLNREVNRPPENSPEIKEAINKAAEYLLNLPDEDFVKEMRVLTFEDFRQAKKVRVIRIKGFAYSLDVEGEYEVDMSDDYFMIGSVGPFDKKRYLGNGLFKWTTGVEIKLEIIE